jgi:zinc-ribbon domain
MSSATLTEDARAARPVDRDAGFRSWHFYILLSMVAATVAVMLTRDTHPAALLLLSAAVVCAGLAGVALHGALAGFGGQALEHGPVLRESDLEVLEREKALTLRSIKELEFDHAMGKLSDADFEDLGRRLRARALALMQQLEAAAGDAAAPSAVPAAAAPEAPGDDRVATSDIPAADPPAAPACDACGTFNDRDARFCKHCGASLAA